jgi:Bacterial PH domain
MMTEYEWEPVPGLPGRLPQGESILWQGSPDWRALVKSAFHLRLIGAYFAVLTVVALLSGSPFGTAATALAGLACAGVLTLLARAMARSSIYTLTNRRIVLRIGVALPMCINLPLALIDAADVSADASGHGDIALSTSGGARVGYAVLWPHVRPWRLAKPQPMLRAVPDAAAVAQRIAKARAAIGPIALAQTETGATPLQQGLAA